MEDIFQRAVTELRSRNFGDAERLFRQILAAQDRHVGALNLLSVVLVQQARFAEAEPLIRRALEVSAPSEATLYNHGIVLKALKRPAEALERFDQALALNPAAAETWNNRGTVLNDLNRHGDAVADFDKALAIDPGYAEALCNKGKSLAALKQQDAALAAYEAALRLKPDLAEAWLGQGNVLGELKRHAGALGAIERALALRSELPEVWVCRGNVLAALNRHDEALASHQRAIALNPGLAEAWLGRGNALVQAGRPLDALAAYERATSLDPDLAEAWFGRGNAMTALNRHAKAFAAYDRALRLKPDSPYAEGNRLHAKLMLCDWSDYQAEVAHLLAEIRRDRPACQPLAALAITASAAAQRQCASTYVAATIAPVPALWRGERYAHPRIRVAYVSGDLHEHPMALLTAGMFEQHDRSRFETFGISFGRAVPGEFRARLERAFDRFIDVSAQDDAAIASLLHQLEIDIAVDLGGHTAGARPGIFAARPCPVQVNYLGFPATMGAPFIDYILADAHVVPPDLQQFYSERVVYLPDTFQANDRARPFLEEAGVRADAGLPEAALVFCSFNQAVKVTPAMFDIWMRLLRRIEDSVLWMLAGNLAAERNLRSEAERRGIDPARVLIAPRAEYRDYLARYRLADLLLDTFPFNAGTTASDALWCGLPVLTCGGEALASRMAGSLLQAAGLPELVTGSLEEYEALALKLARERDLLRGFRERLLRNRLQCPLFDTARFTRHVEAAYATMWQRAQRGQPPASFAVEPIVTS